MRSSAAGHDSFVFDAGFGNDTVKGFHLDSDQIEIDHTLFTSVEDMLQNHTTDILNGSGTVTGVLIQDSQGDSMTILGASTAQLLNAQHDILLL